MNRATEEDSLDRPMKIPCHVAIIMDGNGRWASRRSLNRSAGHFEGVGSVTRITRLCSDLGIEYLTLYGFSTENWNRPQEEVDILMHLIGTTVENETPELLRNNVRLKLIGDIERIPEESRRKLYASVEATSGCTGLLLTMALSYSSRWELTQVARRIAAEAAEGKLDPAAIDDSDIEKRLSTAGIPDPDLLIRTGGEERISNFLLWQCAYSELYFTDVLWPDFGSDAFMEALYDYSNRERRFGKTSAQVTGGSK